MGIQYPTPQAKLVVTPGAEGLQSLRHAPATADSAPDEWRVGRILADTPFPFPWAQLVLTLLLFYALTVPFLVVAFVRAPWLGILINFMCVQASAGAYFWISLAVIGIVVSFVCA